jgi:hypothetical protein
LSDRSANCNRAALPIFHNKETQFHHITSTMATFQVATTRTRSDIAELQQYAYAPTGADVVEMMKNIKEPAAQVAFVTRLLLAPQVTLGSGTTAEKGEKTEKVKKALNAFVGFRCKYKTLAL